ncbi:PaaI family thioesterase [Corynebacterium otitidis]|uniref:PaaI family thioesterase n=1 Tax=Corynebacterium otitidis TaxID=29321 RepID=UPI000627E0F9|nr:PaaI family thioesterase [Corynebacterium otitidis]KKO84622.1 thioesterase [Corynebacterium otitidis]
MEIIDWYRKASERDLSADELDVLNGQKVGLAGHLGIEFSALGPKAAAARLEVGREHLQPAGLVNGGVFASIGETVASVAGIVRAGGVAVVGVNNDTNFIRSVRSGVIEATAEPIQLGRRTQLWRVDMRNEDRLAAQTILRTMVVG